MFAFRLSDGAQVGHTPPTPWSNVIVLGCRRIRAVSAMPSGRSGSLTATYALVRQRHRHSGVDFDTVREYETVNGVPARGGSLDGPGPVIAGGMMFVNSGYTVDGGLPGNVVLAFSVDGK